MNRTTIARTTVAAACVLMLGACSDDEEPSATKGPGVAVLPGSGAQVLVAGPAEEPGDTPITGKPVVVNGCLGAEVNDKTYLVVWPSGTSLDPDGDDAIRVDGEVIGPDSTFAGRGELVFRQPFPDGFPDIPLRCLGPNQEPIAWLQELVEVEG